MTTHVKIPRAHRLRPVLGIAAMLLVSVVVSGKSTLASRCPEQKPKRTAAIAATVQAHVAQAAAQAGAPNRGRQRGLPRWGGSARFPSAVEWETRAAWHDAESVSTGLDLEVRIWNVRIGFPWLKSLPLTPGRRIVLSLWETDPDR